MRTASLLVISIADPRMASVEYGALQSQAFSLVAPLITSLLAPPLPHFARATTSFSILHQDPRSDFRAYANLIDTADASYLSSSFLDAGQHAGERLRDRVFSAVCVRGGSGSPVVPKETVSVGFSLSELHWLSVLSHAL